MSFVKTGLAAIGKLLTVVILAGMFLVGLVGAVYLSLRGEEVKVPEIVGKDYNESEKEIADLGLKIKRRATRYSQEKPNTVLEQLPKPGETVKTGQTILVVLSEASPEGSEAPATVVKPDNTNQEDESTDITPDKPVKSNKNANVKKPSQTTRDVISNKSNKNTNSSNSNSDSTDNSNSKSGDTNKAAGNKNSSTTPSNKTVTPGNSNKVEPKPTPNKPAVTKTPNNGDVRSRKVQ